MLDIPVYLLLQFGFLGLLFGWLRSAGRERMESSGLHPIGHRGAPRQFRGRLPITGYPDGLLQLEAVARDDGQPLPCACRRYVEQIPRHALGGNDFEVDGLTLATMRGDCVAVSKLPVGRWQFPSIFQLDGV